MPDAMLSSNPAVRRFRSFARLSDVERVLLEEVSRPTRKLEARNALIQEGDHLSGAFVVLEGLACRYKQRGSGRRQIMALLIPGDMVAFDTSLQSRMDHSIETLSACHIAWVMPEMVSRLYQHPGLARGLRMSAWVNETTLHAWLMNLGARTALERLAHLFCELYIRHYVVGQTQGQSYDLPLTQADLADITGLSHVHLNRSLQELRHRELIDLRNRRVTIRDWQGLKALAEFEGTYLYMEEDAALIDIEEPLTGIWTGSLKPTKRFAFVGGKSVSVRVRRS